VSKKSLAIPSNRPECESTELRSSVESFAFPLEREAKDQFFATPLSSLGPPRRRRRLSSLPRYCRVRPREPVASFRTPHA
jgi:hypothetical protein